MQFAKQMLDDVVQFDLDEIKQQHQHHMVADDVVDVIDELDICVELDEVDDDEGHTLQITHNASLVVDVLEIDLIDEIDEDEVQIVVVLR